MKFLPLVLLIGLVSACDREITINLPDAPTPPEPPKVVTDVIEFRVDGNASSARIRHSDPFNGLTQTVTTLPYFTSFNSTRSFEFLSVEATPITFPLTVTQPFISVQIVVNGILFREATSIDRFATISASGTYRR